MSVVANNHVHAEGDERLRGRRLIGSVGIVVEVGLRRQVNIEPAEFNDGDVEGLARLEVQWRMKLELVQADKRVASIGGYANTLHLCRRPDAQAASLCLNAVDKRHVEAVQLDARMEAVLECFNNACAEKRLGPVQ